MTSQRPSRGWWMAGVGSVGAVALIVPVAIAWTADASKTGTLVESISGPGPAPASCSQAEELTEATDDGVIPGGISADGRVIAGGGNKLGIWTDGDYSAIDIPNEEEIVVEDVNDAGVVVGTSFGEDDTRWRYEDGELEELKGFHDDDSVSVEAISSDGTAVGSIYREDGSLPVKWEPGKESPTRLELEPGYSGDAVDISADNTILGGLRKGDASEAWVWHADGSAERLPDVPEEDSEYAGTSPAAIAGDWVLVSSSGGETYLLDISQDGAKYTPVEGVSSDSPYYVDEKGRVYGTTIQGNAVVVGAGNDQTELPGLTNNQPDEDSPGHAATAVSADGSTVVGYSLDREYTKDVTWSCRQ